MEKTNKTIAIYPGSFDPITLGHIDIIERSLGFVDELIIAVGHNHEKNHLFTPEERVLLINEVLADIKLKHNSKVKVVIFRGLLVDFAKEVHANVIIRGIRALSDFDFEFNLAGVNHKLNPNIETIFLMASEKHQFISSKFVKELARFGGDMSKFVPNKVLLKLKNKH
jgi:pantetheine-phosphate adenylyltransferase